MATKDRWHKNERVRHPKLGVGRICYVHESGTATVKLVGTGEELDIPTVETCYKQPRTWRRDTRPELHY